jgi:hypothetical protein
MPSFSGFYKAQRNRRTYTFTVSWRHCGEWIIWDADVRLKTETVGRPNGEMRSTKDRQKNVESLLGREVETAIEERRGVEEPART